jgi:hypothetical protein
MGSSSSTATGKAIVAGSNTTTAGIESATGAIGIVTAIEIVTEIGIGIATKPGIARLHSALRPGRECSVLSPYSNM